MGKSQAWFVVESADAAAIAAALDVKLTGSRGLDRKFPLALCRLGDGRILVVSTNADEPLFKSKQLCAVSKFGRAASGFLEEHVMASGFACWSGGRKTWSVSHQGDDNPLHHKTTGKLPREDAALLNAALERQRSAGENAEEDHLFELPLELARRHASIDPNVIGDGEFEQLHIGFWRDLWRRTLWWRILFLFLAGGVVFILGMTVIAKALNWLFEQAGLR